MRGMGKGDGDGDEDGGMGNGGRGGRGPFLTCVRKCVVGVVCVVMRGSGRCYKWSLF